jgi:hypothetical protein
MFDNESVPAADHESEWCPFLFGLLQNTPHSGNIGSTRPSALDVLVA